MEHAYPLMNIKIKKSTRNPKLVGIWFIFMVMFIIELLFYTWSRVQCVRFGYELSEVTDRQKQLILLQNNLKTEVAHLKSPNRIAKIAKDRLDLIMPKPNQMIVIP